MRKRWENQVCCTEYTTSIASGVIRKLIARALPDELEFPAEMQLSHPFFPDEESSPCAPVSRGESCSSQSPTHYLVA
jgi:hypothetical protein